MKSSPQWLLDLETRWQAAEPRERQIARLAAVVIGLALVWLIAVAPAWSTLSKAPTEIDQLDAQLRQMRTMATQVQQLKQAVPVPPEQSAAALRSATERLGNTADLTVTGTQAQLRLRGVSGAALVGWLNEARQTARARPQEAELQAGAQGYTGRLVVVLPGPNGS